MTMIARTCECDPPGKNGGRCFKCGKPMAKSNHRPHPPGLPRPKPIVRGLPITETTVDEFSSLLDKAEPMVEQMEREGRL